MTVSNVAPTVNAGPDVPAILHEEVSISAVVFNDPGTLDTHSATIDWGDGTTSVGAVTETPFGPPGSTGGMSGTVSGSHVYDDMGSHTVTVTVVDDDGSSASDTLAIEVFCTDPVGDVSSAAADADLRRCAIASDGATLTLALEVEGRISKKVQYRVQFENGASFKYANGKPVGPASLTASVDGNTLAFTVDLAEIGLVVGDHAQLFVETQAGIKNSPAEGKPDRMPDSGLLLYVVK